MGFRNPWRINNEEENSDAKIRKFLIDGGNDEEFSSDRTPGFSGADLENFVNEAALLAARKKVVTMPDLDEAKDKVMKIIERRYIVNSEDEKKLKAYYKNSNLTSNEKDFPDPKHKVTIIPRGRSLGIGITEKELGSYGERDSENDSERSIMSPVGFAREVFEIANKGKTDTQQGRILRVGSHAYLNSGKIPLENKLKNIHKQAVPNTENDSILCILLELLISVLELILKNLVKI